MWVKSLPYFGPQYRVIHGHRCSVHRDKWRGRRYSPPFEKYEVEPAVNLVMERLNQQRLQDTIERENPKVIPPELYFEPEAKILGLWVTGSGIAGRYTRNSDVDVWVQIEGLTHQGEKYADQDLVLYMEENDEWVHARGERRKIDVVIVAYPPETDVCRIDFRQYEEDEIETFNRGGSQSGQSTF